MSKVRGMHWIQRKKKSFFVGLLSGVWWGGRASYTVRGEVRSWGNCAIVHQPHIELILHSIFHTVYCYIVLHDLHIANAFKACAMCTSCKSSNKPSMECNIYCRVQYIVLQYVSSFFYALCILQGVFLNTLYIAFLVYFVVHYQY